MKERNRGAIVQVGSALAFRGIPLQAPYCGAKAAGKNFTESVITEVEHHGWNIHIAMVHIAAFNTTQVHVGTYEAAEANAARAADLPAEDRRRRDPLDMAKTGYDSQMTDKPLDPVGRDNLFEPVDMDEDRGSHGPFDDEAHEHSFQTTLSKHRGVAGSVAAGLAAAAGAALLRKRD